MALGWVWLVRNGPDRQRRLPSSSNTQTLTLECRAKGEGLAKWASISVQLGAGTQVIGKTDSTDWADVSATLEVPPDNTHKASVRLAPLGTDAKLATFDECTLTIQ